MRFVITEHAKERLVERVGAKPNKFIKLVKKAWLGKNILIPKVRKAEYRYKTFYKESGNHVYRELMGYVFVFDLQGGNPVLITVI